MSAQGRRDAGSEGMVQGPPVVAAPLRPSVTALNLPRLLGWYLIRGYQRFISPALPPSCRFYPSCADYTSEAVVLHGAGRGLWLGIRRLLRCHPLGGHGVDPVPNG